MLIFRMFTYPDPQDPEPSLGKFSRLNKIEFIPYFTSVLKIDLPQTRILNLILTKILSFRGFYFKN